MEPKVPDLLINRAQDNAFAICAIGDAAGGKWPEIIRAALIGIAAQRDDEQQSAGVLLLRDIAAIFDSKGVTQIGSSELCAELCELEESPWAELRHGASITTHGIAKRLKPFGIRPRRERRGSAYHLADFKDALERYVPADPEKSAASATTATHQNRDDGSGVATDCRETTTQDNPTHWDEFEGEL